MNKDKQLTEDLTLLTRRSAIKRIATLLGGTLAATQLGLLSKSVAAMTADSAPRFLNQNQFLMLQKIVDLIIPETDTPGALGANVHYFVDLMLAEWASPERQARYVSGLADVDSRARKTGADSFSTSTTAQQIVLLQTLDKEAFAQGPQDVFFAELKKMVLFAYYSSEIGATVELRYQSIPGDYVPCMPIDQNARAWFWMGYSYAL